MDRSDLARHVELERARLEALLHREARVLLQREDAEDVVQGIHLRVIEAADEFEWRGEEAFRAWLFEIARQQIARRVAHWKTLKRDARRLLRLAWPTLSGSTSGLDPASPRTGPATWADRREMLALAVQAASTLGERDRRLVARGADSDLDALADELGITPDAAQRARHRALDRFERAYAILARAGGAPGVAT